MFGFMAKDIKRLGHLLMNLIIISMKLVIFAAQSYVS